MSKRINWGIIGCGGIANTFAKGLAKVDSGQLFAVASNSQERANSFASNYQAEKSYNNYQALVTDCDVDAVYIATTHNFHYENAKLCIAHGKHVLCEKPLTVNAKQAAELIELAKANNVFLMEAVWTRFLPAIKKLEKIIADGIIGKVQTLKANFSITGDFPTSHRLLNKDLAGGALLDLGIYPITFAHLVFGIHPLNIQSSAVIGKTGVDESSFYLFDYNNGQRAILSSSFIDYAPTEAVISGTKGFIHIPDFLAARELNLHIENNVPKKISFERSDDENFMFEIEHANQCIQDGKIESSVFPLTDTLHIMETMDTLREQWGLVYNDD
jgi:predicted dehydrogenase